MKTMSFREMFRRLLTADGQGRAARTVELFGWLIMLEGSLMLIAPAVAPSILHLPVLVEQPENSFRLWELGPGFRRGQSGFRPPCCPVVTPPAECVRSGTSGRDPVPAG